MNIPFGFRLAFSIAIPVLIVNRGYKKKSLNLSGALSSLIVGFLLTFANFCFFSALFAFFVSGSFLTKLKADVKRNIEWDFKEGQWNFSSLDFELGVYATVQLVKYIKLQGYPEWGY